MRAGIWERDCVLTKKKIQREHKKADAAGTRAAVKPNGLPVKAPKPTSIVSVSLLSPSASLLSEMDVFMASWILTAEKVRQLP